MKNSLWIMFSGLATLTSVAVTSADYYDASPRCRTVKKDRVKDISDDTVAKVLDDLRSVEIISTEDFDHALNQANNLKLKEFLEPIAALSDRQAILDKIYDLSIGGVNVETIIKKLTPTIENVEINGEQLLSDFDVVELLNHLTKVFKDLPDVTLDDVIKAVKEVTIGELSIEKLQTKLGEYLASLEYLSDKAFDDFIQILKDEKKDGDVIVDDLLAEAKDFTVKELIKAKGPLRDTLKINLITFDTMSDELNTKLAGMKKDGISLDEMKELLYNLISRDLIQTLAQAYEAFPDATLGQIAVEVAHLKISAFLDERVTIQDVLKPIVKNHEKSPGTSSVKTERRALLINHLRIKDPTY